MQRSSRVGTPLAGTGTGADVRQATLTMCNAWNHPASCTCGFGGEGHLGRRGPGMYTTASSSTGPAQSWSLYDSGQRLTYPTSCWWCRDAVYFFRDENGGCALFDSLGPPWPLHSCWEDHTRRSQITSQIQDALVSLDFNGRFYRPQGTRISRPRKDELEVRVSGFVADNRALYDRPKVFRLPAHRRAVSARLVLLEVSDGESIYPFVVQIGLALDIPDYSFVEITGIWRKKSRRWHLWTTSIRRVEPGERRPSLKTHFVLEGACSTCGSQIGENGSWGLDDQGLEECSGCAEMRGKSSRQQFLERIRSIREQLA